MIPVRPKIPPTAPNSVRAVARPAASPPAEAHRPQLAPRLTTQTSPTLPPRHNRLRSLPPPNPRPPVPNRRPPAPFRPRPPVPRLRPPAPSARRLVIEAAYAL
jgi:hypothetical protein